jgi:cell wall-associated NlpC family hydrolase
MFRKKIFCVVLFVLLMVCGVCSADIGKGDRGDMVRDTQNALMIFGYYDDIPNSIFDDKMEEAVKKFQKENQLEVTGKIDGGTYSKLMKVELGSRSPGAVSLIRRIIGLAMSLQGVPYVFGGTSPGGFDCSGFVQYVFRNAGLNLPRMADEQYYAVNKVPVPREGDLVFFTTYTSGVSHVGVYIGNDNFVHASSSRGITVSSLKEDYWSARYVGAGGLL